MIGRSTDSTARTPAPCCPELISAYIDGELSPAEQLRMRRHLAACSGCNERYEDYLDIRSLLRGQPDAVLRPSVRRKIEVRLVGGPERPGGWIRLGSTASLAAGLAALAFTAGLYLAGEPTSGQTIARLSAAPREVQSRLVGSVTMPATATLPPSAAAGATDGSDTGSNTTASGESETRGIPPAAPLGRPPTWPPAGGQTAAPDSARVTGGGASSTSLEPAGDSAVSAGSVPAGATVTDAGSAGTPPANAGLPNLLPRVPGSTRVAATPTVPGLLPYIEGTATPEPTQPPPTPVPATPTLAGGTSGNQPPPPRPTTAPSPPSPNPPVETPGETVAVVRAEPTTPPTPAPTRPPAAPATETPVPPPAATSTAVPPTAEPTEPPTRPTVAPTEVVETTLSGESLDGTALGAASAVRPEDECVVQTLPVYARNFASDPVVEAALGCALAPAEVAAIQVQTFRGGWLLHPGRPYPVYAVTGTRVWDSLGHTTIPTILAAGGPATLGAPLGAPWTVRGVVQEFEGGLALSGPEGYIFILLYDGRARVY